MRPPTAEALYDVLDADSGEIEALYDGFFEDDCLLCRGLNGFSTAGLWVILRAMTADVIDFDELRSGKRREGASTSTFSWTVKVAMMLSMLLGGPLLQLTGFDAKLPAQSSSAVFGIRLLFAGIPVTTLVIALLLIQFYALDTERMSRIRAQLEARRGSV